MSAPSKVIIKTKVSLLTTKCKGGNGDRVRVSVRLDTTVDEKLDQLAKLRGLDRNTAISVAIVQDWLACVGPNHPKRSDT